MTMDLSEMQRFFKDGEQVIESGVCNLMSTWFANPEFSDDERQQFKSLLMAGSYSEMTDKQLSVMNDCAMLGFCTAFNFGVGISIAKRKSESES